MSKLLTGFQIFLTFLFFAGFLVEAHPVEECGNCFNLFPFGIVIYPFEHLASEKPLEVFCTKLTDFYKCIQNNSCFEPRAPPQFLLEDRYGNIFRGIAKSVNITDELCTNGTQLIEDYSECFGNLHNNVTEECKEQSFQAFFHYIELEMGENNVDVFHKYICLLESYRLGCLGNAIQDECGDTALDTFKEIIKIFRIFEIGFCSSEIMQTIATSFINSLNMTESRKEIYHDCILSSSTSETETA